MTYSLSLTETQYKELKTHLLKDNKEAGAVIFCSPCKTKNNFKFIVYEINLICNERTNKRTSSFLSWNSKDIFNYKKIEELDKHKFSILTIHSHPNGYNDFSQTDNENDKKLFQSINAWFDDNRPNGSAVFLSNGKIKARVVDYYGNFTPIEKINIIGESLKFDFYENKDSSNEKKYFTKVAQTFGKGTLNTLKKLKVAIVGCSGTGSIVAELLARNCVGELLLVDQDNIEEKNLNRIVNSKKIHATNNKSKVVVLKEAIEEMGLGTKVSILEKATYEKGVLHRIKGYDIVFGCVDSAEGKLHLDILCCSYLIPYFDVGVKLEVKKNIIEQAIAKVRYIKPEGPSLLDMKGYTLEQVSAEESKRVNPEYYEKNKIAGYLESVQEDQPAVISLNMQASCLSVNDFLARLHNFRFDSNNEFLEQSFSLTQGDYKKSSKSDINIIQFKKYFANGDNSPLMLNK